MKTPRQRAFEDRCRDCEFLVPCKEAHRDPKCWRCQKREAKRKEKTVTQVEAYIELHKVIAEAIREAGEIPSGHLYAQVMGHMTLATYERIVETLIGAKLITRSSHLLKWVGPVLGAEGRA